VSWLCGAQASCWSNCNTTAGIVNVGGPSAAVRRSMLSPHSFYERQERPGVRYIVAEVASDLRASSEGLQVPWETVVILHLSLRRARMPKAQRHA